MKVWGADAPFYLKKEFTTFFDRDISVTVLDSYFAVHSIIYFCKFTLNLL